MSQSFDFFFQTKNEYITGHIPNTQKTALEFKEISTNLGLFNIMAVIRNAYFKYIKIKYLCYSGDARRCRKADLETSRLFYERF